MNLDGWAGCFLPAWLIKAWASLRLMGLAAAAMLYVIGITVRIRNEEEMLKAAFSKEWEEYHKNTARFIPGII
jgi:protein-S-isoprenylcysteine O-methyltransferase Ste14